MELIKSVNVIRLKSLPSSSLWSKILINYYTRPNSLTISNNNQNLTFSCQSDKTFCNTKQKQTLATVLKKHQISVKPVRNETNTMDTLSTHKMISFLPDIIITGSITTSLSK